MADAATAAPAGATVHAPPVAHPEQVGQNPAVAVAAGGVDSSAPDAAAPKPPHDAPPRDEPVNSSAATGVAADRHHHHHDHHDQSHASSSRAIVPLPADDDADGHDHAGPPGGYDPTPLPPCDGPGFTVQFTFHRAVNLPIGDIGYSSSDPYIAALLTTDVPRRHDEDPPMAHRTRTIHRSTEPVWDEEWIVANIPSSGFQLECRLYDEDAADHDDRLGAVTYTTDVMSETWPGVDHGVFDIRKRVGSKRAYLLKAAAAALTGASITPTLELSIRVLGRSDPPGGRVYTVGPTGYVRHFSPMIGRITKTLVNKDERDDEKGDAVDDIDAAPAALTAAVILHRKTSERQTKRYDFQADEIQLQGPPPEQLYHRYVEFRPIIGRMFSSHGLRGRILNKALHKQHNRIYNFGRTTEYGSFPPCSEQASLQFLKLVHFDQGGRIFTYMLSLDSVLRFTETGREFGIDLLSKHTMHSDVATYVAFAGEFFVRRRPRLSASAADKPAPTDSTHAAEPPPHQPQCYQLIIDNASGTYRPNKALLPLLKAFLEKNLPGLAIVAMHWEDERLQEMKKAQNCIKKHEGPGIQMVLNRSPSSSSISSSDESRLSSMDVSGDDADGNGADGTKRFKSKKELAWDLLEDPARIKDLPSAMQHHT